MYKILRKNLRELHVPRIDRGARAPSPTAGSVAGHTGSLVTVNGHVHGNISRKMSHNVRCFLLKQKYEKYIGELSKVMKLAIILSP